jgi:glutamate/tyrosine decarboxylase-like PLP-dependent enzyme
VQDWQVPLGRRFRALKLWFVMRTYGGEGLRAYLRHHISLAANFAQRIERDPRFKLAAPPRFSLVCFTLAVSAHLYFSGRGFKCLLPSLSRTAAFGAHTVVNGFHLHPCAPVVFSCVGLLD